MYTAGNILTNITCKNRWKAKQMKKERVEEILQRETVYRGAD